MVADIIRLIKSFTKTERLIFFGASAISLVALLFIGINAFYSNTTIQPAQGGEYKEGVVGQPIAINPIYIGTNEADNDLVTLTFASLGILAEKITTSTDGKTFIVSLKPELTWTDGEAITTDDIIFTLETIQNEDANSPLVSSWQGVVTERLSEREMRFTIRTPYIYFTDNLNNFRPIPKHIFETIPTANLRLSNYNLEPVGSGPYQFLRYEKQKSGFLTMYELAANPGYAGTYPHIQTFKVRFFQNYKEALDAFNTKNIDGLGGLDPTQLNSLSLVHKIIEVNLPRYYAIFLNGSVQPILKDVAVRKALSRATNKQRLIQEVLGGHAVVANGPILPTIEGYDADVYVDDRFVFDEASSTLEKAGWKMTAEGVRAKTTGKTTQKLELELIVPEILFLTKTAEIIQSNWAALGVKLTLTILPPSEITNTLIKSRSYQMLLFGNVLRGNPDIFSFWHSSQRFQPGLNLSLYENKTVDGLLEAARKEQSEAARLTTLSKIQKQIALDQPAIFLYSPTYLYAAPRDLGGFDPQFLRTSADRFEHISSWYLKTTRVFQ